MPFCPERADEASVGRPRDPRAEPIDEEEEDDAIEEATRDSTAEVATSHIRVSVAYPQAPDGVPRTPSEQRALLQFEEEVGALAIVRPDPSSPSPRIEKTRIREVTNLMGVETSKARLYIYVAPRGGKKKA